MKCMMLSVCLERNLMRALCFLMLAFASVSVLSGCQCFRATDCVMDQLDDLTDINDFRYKLDRCYCEKVDVTRWCMNGPCARNSWR